MKVGDAAAVLDEAITGVIIKVDGNTITLKTDDGFMLTFNKNELVKIDKHMERLKDVFNSHDFKTVLVNKEGFKKAEQSRPSKQKREQPVMEVDLHIEKLVVSKRGMTNYDILNLQLETAKHKLEFAIRKRIQRVVFIHGVGEGVLKQELETLFNRYDNLNYYDASYQKYGFGATEVYIPQNTVI